MIAVCKEWFVKPSSGLEIHAKHVGKVANSGVRFDFGSSNPPTDNVIAQNEIEEVGNSFTVTVPAYTISDMLIPAK
jgi:hypothetical protein